MKNRKIYSVEDCEVNPDGYAGEVVVLNPGSIIGQLAYCYGYEKEQWLRLIGLYEENTEEIVCRKEDEILGVLKPERLPDRARLILSQVRPEGDFTGEEEEILCGYCFLADGAYRSGVWMHSLAEALAYVKMQAPYQHRVMLCDEEDYCILEMVEGKIVFPHKEILRCDEQ